MHSTEAGPGVDRGLDLLLGKLEELSRTSDPHRRAAYRALMPLMEQWLAPGNDAGNLAERIERDLEGTRAVMEALAEAYRGAVAPLRRTG